MEIEIRKVVVKMQEVVVKQAELMKVMDGAVKLMDEDDISEIMDLIAKQMIDREEDLKHFKREFHGEWVK